MKIGIIGGTGAMGSGLAAHLSKENEVRIGSRDLAKARATAAKIPGVEGGKDTDVADWCEVAIVAVPFSAIGELGALAGPLSGKAVISMVNPLKREGGLLEYAEKQGSAAEAVAASLRGSRVATGFNNVPAAFFRKPFDDVVDILVATDSRSTFDEVAPLIRSVARMRPLYVGPLSQAISVERLTVMVLNAAKLNGGSRFSVKFVS